MVGSVVVGVGIERHKMSGEKFLGKKVRVCYGVVVF